MIFLLAASLYGAGCEKPQQNNNNNGGNIGISSVNTGNQPTPQPTSNANQEGLTSGGGDGPQAADPPVIMTGGSVQFQFNRNRFTGTGGTYRCDGCVLTTGFIFDDNANNPNQPDGPMATLPIQAANGNCTITIKGKEQGNTKEIVIKGTRNPDSVTLTFDESVYKRRKDSYVAFSRSYRVDQVVFKDDNQNGQTITYSPPPAVPPTLPPNGKASIEISYKHP
jgi:hypothetical protein